MRTFDWFYVMLDIILLLLNKLMQTVLEIITNCLWQMLHNSRGRKKMWDWFWKFWIRFVFSLRRGGNVKSEIFCGHTPCCCRTSDQAGSLFWRGHLWMPEALWYSVKASALNIKTHVGAFLCRIPHMPRWKRQEWTAKSWFTWSSEEIHTKHLALNWKDTNLSFYLCCVSVVVAL